MRSRLPSVASGRNALPDPGWTTVAETDDDNIPAGRPILMPPAPSGRVGWLRSATRTWADHLIGHLDNGKLGVRCAEWLLFRI